MSINRRLVIENTTDTSLQIADFKNWFNSSVNLSGVAANAVKPNENVKQDAADLPILYRLVNWKWNMDDGSTEWYPGTVQQVSSTAVTVLYEDGTTHAHPLPCLGTMWKYISKTKTCPPTIKAVKRKISSRPCRVSKRAKSPTLHFNPQVPHSAIIPANWLIQKREEQFQKITARNNKKKL